LSKIMGSYFLRRTARRPTPDDVKTVTVALELVDKPPRRNPWRPTVLTVRKFLKNLSPC